MRGGLPSTYDAHALASHYSGAAGQSQLSERAAFIATSTLALSARVLPDAAASLPLGSSDAFWERQSPAVVRWVEQLGPTAIKFGQAAANRPDLVGVPLANALRLLQDACEPFDLETAKRIIHEDLDDDVARDIIAALPSEPAAAASFGQVYKLQDVGGRRRHSRRGGGGGAIALKLLRPGSRDVVAMDAMLARRAACWLETLVWPSNGERLVKPALVAGVDEFFSRLFEEMDYENELNNLDAFNALYGKGGRAYKALRRSSGGGYGGRGGGGGGGEIIIPKGIRRYSGGRCLAMSWLDGEKLLSRADATLAETELPLVKFGIEATLSQMLEEGIMHADPHGGNLLRAPPPKPSRLSRAGAVVLSPFTRVWRGVVRRQEQQKPPPQHSTPPPPRLAYLDFGLMSAVPQQVRDGLVCAVAQMLFARDARAVADLFDELMLLPPSELQSDGTRQELQDALEQLADRALVWPDAASTAGGQEEDGSMPTLEFGALITELALLAPRFALELPPYFLNNARALATLEGMAKSADPTFDVLQAVYPFALRRLLTDPNGSPIVRRTLDDLTRDEDGRLDLKRVEKLLSEAARLSKQKRRHLVVDALRTRGGRALAKDVALASVAQGLRLGSRRS